MKPQHIGIVACSAEGAALCYKTICVEGAQLLGPHAHPEVSMHTPSLADYVACLERGDLPGVADLMLASAEKLARIGADFLICPDNTIHEALPLVLPRSPLPWLHIAEVVAAEAAARGFRRLGITGTRWLVDSEVYPEALSARGLDYLRPTAAERDETNRIIMEELVYDTFRPDSVAYFQRVIARMKDEGCDAVILGCTEIPLIVSDANCSLPTLDSTRLLARAALRRAVHERRRTARSDHRPGADAGMPGRFAQPQPHHRDDGESKSSRRRPGAVHRGGIVRLRQESADAVRAVARGGLGTAAACVGRDCEPGQRTRALGPARHVHPLENGSRPHNCLYLIGPDGTVRTRYDKRFCSHNELSGWYTPGAEPILFDINGVRFIEFLAIEVSRPSKRVVVGRVRP